MQWHICLDLRHTFALYVNQPTHPLVVSACWSVLEWKIQPQANDAQLEEAVHPIQSRKLDALQIADDVFSQIPESVGSRRVDMRRGMVWAAFGGGDQELDGDRLQLRGAIEMLASQLLKESHR